MELKTHRARARRQSPRAWRTAIVKVRFELQALFVATRDDDAPVPSLAVHGENGVQTGGDFEKARGEVLDLLIRDEIPEAMLDGASAGHGRSARVELQLCQAPFGGDQLPQKLLEFIGESQGRIEKGEFFVGVHSSEGSTAPAA